MVRMPALLLPAALACLLSAGAASAAEPPPGAVPPDQATLRALIAGNSIEGTWAGREYEQYFSPSGATHYREQDGRPSQGTWRVNADGQYCSVWPPAAREDCYTVRVLGAAIYWPAGDEWYPSQVVQGNVFER